MPTLEQMAENVKEKIRKYGPHAHCGMLVVSEELREKAIKNAPDAEGRQRTRIALECYAPASYSLWNEIIEMLMEKLGYNPILLVDVLALLVRSAGYDGIQIIVENLAKVCDYEAELKQAKTARRERRFIK